MWTKRIVNRRRLKAELLTLLPIQHHQMFLDSLQSSYLFHEYWVMIQEMKHCHFILRSDFIKFIDFNLLYQFEKLENHIDHCFAIILRDILIKWCYNETLLILINFWMVEWLE